MKKFLCYNTGSFPGYKAHRKTKAMTIFTFRVYTSYRNKI